MDTTLGNGESSRPHCCGGRCRRRTLPGLAHYAVQLNTTHSHPLMQQGVPCTVPRHSICSRLWWDRLMAMNEMHSGIIRRAAVPRAQQMKPPARLPTAFQNLRWACSLGKPAEQCSGVISVIRRPLPHSSNRSSIRRRHVAIPCLPLGHVMPTIAPGGHAQPIHSRSPLSHRHFHLVEQVCVVVLVAYFFAGW